MKTLWIGFLRLNRGIWAMAIGWRLWVLLLGAVNLLPPFFFLDRLEARVVLGVMVASALLMAVLAGVYGFTRILGAGHMLWLGLVPWVASRWAEAPIEEPLGLWLRAVVVVNTISLAIDFTDVARYLLGETDEVVGPGTD